MVEKYFINDPSLIEEIQFQRKKHYDSFSLWPLDDWYKNDPCYKDILDRCRLARQWPERHQIVQSTDINSCFRYISFNHTDKTLYVTAHFRSQNNLTEKEDFVFIRCCTTNYLSGMPPVYEDYSIDIIVDEFLILKELN